MSAMLQNRPYRKKMLFAQAVADIVKYSGKRYDPRVVGVLLDRLDRIENIMQCLEMEQKNQDGSGADGQRKSMA